MKSAIITGANGLIGQALVTELIKNNVAVLCLGRRPQQVLPKPFPSPQNAAYLRLDMSKIRTLADKVRTVNLPVNFFEHCVFFHLAWEGETGLTDGDLNKQLTNASNTTEAIKIAKRLGCEKFINLGTITETLMEHALQNNSPPFDLQQFNYGIAKLASRDMAKITSYLEKIDYIHARVSVPLDDNLNSGGYICSTLKKIALGEPYDDPLTHQPYDLVFVSDVARALRLIGMSGEDKQDYYIGSGRCKRLKTLFDQFKSMVDQRLGDIEALDNEEQTLAFLFDASLLGTIGDPPREIDYQLLRKTLSIK